MNRCTLSNVRAHIGERLVTPAVKCYSGLVSKPMVFDSIEALSVSVRQGAGLTRLRDEAGDSYRVIQTRDLSPGGIAGRGELQEELLSGRQLDQFAARAGQVLMPLFASSLHPVVVGEEHEGCIVSSNIAIITVNSKRVVAEYLAAVLNSESAHVRLKRVAAGASIQMLSVASLREFRIPVPAREVQVQFARAFGLHQRAKRAAEQLLQSGAHRLEHSAAGLWEMARVS